MGAEGEAGAGGRVVEGGGPVEEAAAGDAEAVVASDVERPRVASVGGRVGRPRSLTSPACSGCRSAPARGRHRRRWRLPSEGTWRGTGPRRRGCRGGSPEARITAGNRLKSIRTARSALLAARPASDSTAPIRRENGAEWRESAARTCWTLRSPLRTVRWDRLARVRQARSSRRERLHRCHDSVA